MTRSSDLLGCIVEHARYSPEKPAIWLSRGSVSYDTLLKRITDIAKSLRPFLRRRAPLTVVGSNSLALVELLYATFLNERSYVILDHRLPAADIERVVVGLGCSTLALCGEARKRTDLLHRLEDRVVTTIAGDCDLVLLGPGSSDSTDVALPERPCMVLFTSGTTGAPKGLILTSECILARLQSWTRMLNHSSEDIFCCALPLSHLAGWEIHVLCALSLGATVCLFESELPNPVVIWKTLRQQRVSMFSATPALYSMLLKAVPNRSEMPSMCKVLSHSSPLHRALADEIWAATGIRILNEYGTCETGPTHINLQSAASKPDSIGRAWLDVSCETEAGAPFSAAAKPSTLFVRSPLLAYGLVRDMGSVTRLHQPYNMQDVAKVDSDGNYYILGRIDDVLNFGGYKAYPVEIESVIRRVDGVVDCCAFVLTKEGTSQLHVAIECDARFHVDAARSLCHDLLPIYKRPVMFHVLRELPRNRVGKIVRAQVAAQLG
jgi:acyl-coenzyme A synthetase/AMP-(fatty) acid ligase